MKTTTKNQTWYWLTDTERRMLEDFNSDAETIVNKHFKPDDLLMTEQRVIPENGKAWLPEKCIVIRQFSREMVQVHHPMQPEFTKMDYRNCVVFKTRGPYGLQNIWRDMVYRCMKPSLLKALRWAVYDVSGDRAQHIYLECDIPGPATAKHVSLYVPTSYFREKKWEIVEKFHTDVAVAYYKNGNFGSAQEMAAGWAKLTAAALTSLEARVLRAIVEETL